MTQARIRQSFETALNTWASAQSPVMEIAWENVTFEPPRGRYVRAFLLPAETTSFDVLRATRSYKGLFQITLCMPRGVGMGAAEALIASLDAAMPPGTPLTAGGLSVWITEPISAGPAIADADQVQIPLSLYYQAHST